MTILTILQYLSEMMHISNDLPNSKNKFLVVFFVDFVLKKYFRDYTHYDKQHKTFALVDYVFMIFGRDHGSMQSTQISISDT